MADSSRRKMFVYFGTDSVYPTLFARFQPRNCSNIVFNQIKE